MTVVRRAFTLIELSVVIVLLALLAGLVVPNLVNQRDARQTRLALIQARDALVEAQARAVREGQTVAVRFDEASQTLTIVRPADVLNAAPITGAGLTGTASLAAARQAAFGSANDVDTNDLGESVLRRVRLGGNIRGRGFRVADETVVSGEFLLRFYADGKSDGGALEFDVNGASRSIVVDRNGDARIENGGLPDVQTDEWQAGENERRT
ncbi:MAG: prepilin-type N-terminal cleavage/methylation domain-containing protein [Fimbriimonadaceae bacterium]